MFSIKTHVANWQYRSIDLSIPLLSIHRPICTPPSRSRSLHKHAPARGGVALFLRFSIWCSFYFLPHTHDSPAACAVIRPYRALSPSPTCSTHRYLPVCPSMRLSLSLPPARSLPTPTPTPPSLTHAHYRLLSYQSPGPIAACSMQPADERRGGRSSSTRCASRRRATPSRLWPLTT
jgi:hypothetical protein